MVKRSAFSMIELIFAIVLIALVVVAVPGMITRNVQTLSGSLVQQELFIAARTASELLTQPWDTNSIDTTTSRAYTKVLDTAAGGSLARVSDAAGNLLPFRIGHIRQDNHRRFHNDPAAASSFPSSYQIPKDSAMPSLPKDTNLSIVSGWSGENSATFFANTPSTAGLAAVKMATITVKNTKDTSRTVTLRVYLADIGEYSYASRRF